MLKQKSVFIVSLDLELNWGMRDKKPLEIYKDNLLGVRDVVPALLGLFDKYKIHATWAAVGFLFFETRDELIKNLPLKKPNYKAGKLSPYLNINSIGADEKEDPYHYAASLIKLIASSPNQEIGSHTFSHYYCLEKGQDINIFKADLEAGNKIAAEKGLAIKSLIFPRNQFNNNYLSVCKEMGIRAFRGNEAHFLYRARSDEAESLFGRGLRFLDSYFNISGHNAYPVDNIGSAPPFNIKASRFLRPYRKCLSFLEPLRLRRILSDLTYAAKHGLVYHLWWHPHNFGINLEENMSLLSKVLDHYLKLQKAYGMESLNMGELSQATSRASPV